MPAARVAIIFQGTRGDSQPYFVAGCVLQRAGYDVMLAGSSDSEPLAAQLGLPFVPYLPSTRELITRPDFVQACTRNSVSSMVKAQSAAELATYPSAARLLHGLLRDWKPDLVLCGGVNLLDIMAFSNALGFAFCLLLLQVSLRSSHVGAMGLLPTCPAWTGLNLVAWDLLLRCCYTQASKDHAPVLEELLHRPRASFWPTLPEVIDVFSGARTPFPIFLAVSTALNGPLPRDFSKLCRPLGPLMFSPEEQRGPDFGGAELEAMRAFLQAGEAPVYLGFGSITCHDARFMTLLSLRALRLTGRRGVLLAGWAGMSLQHLEGAEDEAELRAYCAERVLFMETAPHGALFPACAALVHHGGAGTLNASLRSGKPTVVLPIILDQFPHAELVNRRGVGVGLPGMRCATPELLAAAIRRCLECQEVRLRAQELARLLSAEDGQARLRQEVGRYLEEAVLTGEHRRAAERWRARHRQAARGCCAPCCPKAAGAAAGGCAQAGVKASLLGQQAEPLCPKALRACQGA